jgi:hypothetical protein
MLDADFEMRVSEVFVLTERGVVVASGEAVTGELRGGAVVQVWQDDRLLSTSPAHVELHTRAGTVALALTEPGVRVQPGCVIRTAPQ